MSTVDFRVQSAVFWERSIATISLENVLATCFEARQEKHYILNNMITRLQFLFIHTYKNIAFSVFKELYRLIPVPLTPNGFYNPDVCHTLRNTLVLSKTSNNRRFIELHSTLVQMLYLIKK